MSKASEWATRRCTHQWVIGVDDDDFPVMVCLKCPLTRDVTEEDTFGDPGRSEPTATAP